ncbi:MAG: alginate lyase family protein, partial [Thermodesulfobacteriota bacterium]|nr:alginate lyase family protein [Thermodesulfobacteriota bacterium]
VKFVWEINRLDFLPFLGLAYHLTGKNRYAEKILSTVAHWQQENPYLLGVNWTSGIELGLRVANLLWALSFLDKYKFSDADYQSLNSFILFHARHLYRYPSRYSSNNNHALAEAFGLFLCGVYFPHLKNSDKWLEFGQQTLERECLNQILPDGGSFEYSTTYLSFVFDFFLLYRHVCIRSGLEYSSGVDHRLKQACYFINSIMDRDGHVPNMGDQDSAVLVNFGLSNAENFISILNTGAVIFNEPELVREPVDLKTFMLTGETEIGQKSSFQSLNENSETESVLHKEIGLAVIRDRVGGQEVLFVGNAMPLGMAPLYAHGHLEALSFTLSVEGKEVFVDPGTYLYNSGGKWREYFRSTAAHNTLRLNGQDFSKQTGDFMFGKPYQITENLLEKADGKVCWRAGHNAYMKKSPFASVDRKTVWENENQVFRILDSVKGREQFFAELFFHFHPECRVKEKENGFEIAREGVEVFLETDAAMESDLLYGSTEPICGWYSPEFNKIMKSLSVRLYGTFDKTADLKTNIWLRFPDEHKNK